jgi:uncharacterized membrane protein
MLSRFGSHRIALAMMSLFAVTIAIYAAERGSIRGKVESDSGKGVNGAIVIAERDGVDPVQVKCNEKGEFKLDLEPGEYSLSVEAEGYKNVKLLRKQKVESGKTTKLEGKITLETSTSSTLLRGAVFTERGFSLPGAKVEIERVAGAGKEEKLRKQYTTNTAGEFAFRLPDDGGQYRLTASARGYEPSTQTIELLPGESRNVAFSLKAATK